MHIDGKVDCDKVSFAYPPRSEVPNLRGLTCDLPQGKKIALCGASGGGKSTIAGLLRYYDVSAGSVRLDALNVRDWNIRSLRSPLSIVGQEQQLFDMLIKENIRYSKPDADMDAVINAAKVANIHDFIESQPEKYETRFTSVGASGGQKQRLCIGTERHRQGHQFTGLFADLFRCSSSHCARSKSPVVG
jgi:ABC-type multidrug transport system fused ATPase/permease subunit